MYTTPKISFQMLSYNDICKLNIIKPNCQRAIDSEQINKIHEYQIRHFEQFNEFFFANPIIIGCISGNPPKYYIIDGQHRLSCIERLSKIDKYHPFTIPCTILYVENETELDEKYVAINQNKPVPLPSNINEWKNFTRYIEEHLQQFQKYFSHSDKPQSPNFNKELLMKYINTNNIARLCNNNYTLFIDEMKKLNSYYRETHSTSIAEQFNKDITPVIHKCIQKQPDNPFILGIYRKYEWINFILHKIRNNIEYENIKHTPVDYKRPRIKKKLKCETWKKRNNNTMDGTCYCCNESLFYDNMECGHVKAHYKGGETILSNLEPICGVCNRDMGVRDLEDYKNELSNELS